MRSKTVFNIDSFGHPASLPQILAGCGIENYVFWRPNEEHMHIETPLFTWLGDNGKSVKAYRLGIGSGDIFSGDVETDALKPLINEAKEAKHDLMAVYGVTDHGGAPTKNMIEVIMRCSAEQSTKHEIRFGKTDEFFENADMKISQK